MGLSRDLNVVVITFVIVLLLKILALEGNVLTPGHSSAFCAQIQRRVILSILWHVANSQTSSSEAVFLF